MSEKISDKYRKIFDKIDRQIEIQNQINETFREYDYIIQLREFLSHLKLALNGLGQAIRDLGAKGFDQETMLRAYSEVKFYYFSVFSTQLAFENYLYSLSKKLKSMEDFHAIIDEWKHRPEVKLVKEIRNRIQHGALMDGNLQIEETMKTPSKSRSLVVCYMLDEDIWRKVVACVDRNAKDFFHKFVKPERDSLYFLATKYDESLSSLFDLIHSKFIQIYPSEMAERQTLLNELDGIEKWFKAKGLSRF